MGKNIIFASLAVFILGIFVLGLITANTPTLVERQLAAGEVEWVEVPPPPDSGFDRCWAMKVGDATGLQIGIVCK